MGEKYIGVKFRTILKMEDFHEDKSKELIYWCKRLNIEGLVPPYEHEGGTASPGNLSFRTKDGFVITSTMKNFSTITKDDLVKVANCSIENRLVNATGWHEPSSESLMHWLVYNNRPDVNAIFHCHDKEVLKNHEKLGLVCTGEERPYGTIELANEIMKTIDMHNYLVMKKHGILSIGKTMKDAGSLAIETHKNAANISRPEAGREDNELQIYGFR